MAPQLTDEVTMKYILDEQFRLRGWENCHTGIFSTLKKTPRFVSKEIFLFLLRCDGAHDINEEELSEENRKLFRELKEKKIIRPADFMEFLRPEQEYKVYPAKYKRQVHWSITGECNLKCRHCFMSAPHAKHGAPTYDEIINIADQLAECGVFQVGLTGGEPLIRKDFPDILDALKEREIGVATIYTNGVALDEALLNELENREMHPGFQLSFDGLGCHDLLRGVPGSEERTIKALELLKEREYGVSVSMCMHRKNKDVLRQTVNFLASVGVRSMKCGSMQEQGEWLSPEISELHLSKEEELKIFEEYIPQYFEDDAPLSIMLSGAFMYRPGKPKWDIYYRRHCDEKEEELAPSCGVLLDTFYIGAEGMVCPCMGMGDCSYAKNFQNLFETLLKDILNGAEFTELCGAKVKDIRDHNPKCRTCKYVDRCTGGCRNGALIAGDDYFATDPDICWFFEHDGEERITAAAQAPFAEYIKRNPPVERKKSGDKEAVTTAEDCP